MRAREASGSVRVRQPAARHSLAQVRRASWGAMLGNASSFGISTEELPNNLLAQTLTANLIAAIYRAEYKALSQAGGRSPGIDHHLCPRRHRDGAHAAVLADEIHDAPPAISLLNVLERERGHF
jgi:hypothetical protein